MVRATQDRVQPKGRNVRSNGQSSDKVVDLPLCDLRFGLSPRVRKHDSAHVELLAQVLDSCPPILVQIGTGLIVDGVHRVLAAQTLGRRTIAAVMFEGTDIAAYMEAVRRNVAHGKPLSLAEREAAIIRILALNPRWSDRRLAGVCGLSDKVVARLRARSTADYEQLNGREGRDGRVRPVDPARVREEIARKLEHEPTTTLRGLATSLNTSPATVLDVQRRLRRGEDPLPTRLRRHRSPSGQVPESGASLRWSQDSACCSTPAGLVFAHWFDSVVIEMGAWRSHIDAVPLGRIPPVIQEVRRQVEDWSAFASALEERERSLQSQDRHSPRAPL